MNGLNRKGRAVEISDFELQPQDDKPKRQEATGRGHFDAPPPPPIPDGPPEQEIPPGHEALPPESAKPAAKESVPPRREFVDWENHPEFIKIRETQAQSAKLMKIVAGVIVGLIVFFILITSCSFKKSLDPVIKMDQENRQSNTND